MTPKSNIKGEEELRDEWRKWITNRPMAPGYGEICNLWLNKIKERDEELIKKIEGMRKERLQVDLNSLTTINRERKIYNTALFDIIHLLTNK